MDTEFPGVVVKPADAYNSPETLEYQAMRCNVDVLKLIQIGITLGNKAGRHYHICWQFNFQFNLDIDPNFSRAINLLKDSNIDFEKFKQEGIHPYDFARLVIPSGLVMNHNLTWITFHGSSDFGYLIKVLTAKPLPETESQFLSLLEVYIPQYYDIKYYVSSNSNLCDGLQRLADQLGIKRLGQEHQAGSDSYVTIKVFYELMHRYSTLQEKRFQNKLFGITQLVSY